MKTFITKNNDNICHCLPPDRTWPIKVEIKGRGCRERAETRTLLVIDPLSAMWI